MFIGRQNELQELQDHAANPGGKAKILVVTGRRRVGKSTLIKRFGQIQTQFDFFKVIGIPPQKDKGKKHELNELANQIQETFGVPKPVLHDWSDAMFAIGTYLQSGNCIFLIGEINWFGKSHSDITGTLFSLWETKLSDIPGLTLILTGSLAGWISDNITNHTSFYGRISYEGTLQALPLKDALSFIPPDRAKRISKHEKMSFLLVSGGIPFYLEQYDFAKGYEIDLLIETSRHFYIVECKYYSGEVPQKVANEIKTKLERFGMPRNKSVKTAVLHVNGAARGLVNNEYIDICANIFDHL